MSKDPIQWPEHKGYKKQMNLPAKVLLFLGIIHYTSEKKYGFEFVGRYSYRLLNPLTWLFCILLYMAALLCRCFDAIFKTYLELGALLRDGVEVQIPIPRNYTRC